MLDESELSLHLSMQEAQNLDLEKTLEIIRSQGAVQGVMYLLLLSMSAHLTKVQLTNHRIYICV